jgi:hypothetical protein
MGSNCTPNDGPFFDRLASEVLVINLQQSEDAQEYGARAKPARGFALTHNPSCMHCP